MRDTFLTFSRPLIGEEEIAEVVDALRSGWLTSGPRTKKFEEAFCRFTKSPGALALNSCTAGLHLALMTLEIGQGDEVITTPLTFSASVNVIEHVGAVPVLVDVEPDTLNIDPAAIESAVTPRTKAIIAVHYAGHPVDLDALRSIAEEHNLHLIEDAAHAVGAEWRGQPIGSGGNPTAFSFYATKNLTTGEGGMLTGAPDFLDEARVTSLHGMSREAWGRYAAGGRWAYDVVRPGFKYNMTDIHAALGLRQLDRFAAMQRRRQQIVSQYDAAFGGMNSVQIPARRDDITHAWHLYVLRLRDSELMIDRDRFFDEMSARQIGCSVHFIPIHQHSYYRKTYGYTTGDFPVCDAAFRQIISLPLSPAMTDQDVSDVIEAVCDIDVRFRRIRAAA